MSNNSWQQQQHTTELWLVFLCNFRAPCSNWCMFMFMTRVANAIGTFTSRRKSWLDTKCYPTYCVALHVAMQGAYAGNLPTDEFSLGLSAGLGVHLIKSLSREEIEEWCAVASTCSQYSLHHFLCVLSEVR